MVCRGGFCAPGVWRRAVAWPTGQMEFAPVQQFPLDVIPRFQADGGGQGEGKAHVQPGLLDAQLRFF